jgi:hypothetical protein
MAYIPPEIEESILFLNEIRNSKSLIGFAKTPKVAHKLRDKKLGINVRVGSKLQ